MECTGRETAPDADAFEEADGVPVLSFLSAASDLSGFSLLSERLSPPDVLESLLLCGLRLLLRLSLCLRLSLLL